MQAPLAVTPLLAFFDLWWTTAIAAAGAASVPVIIHLLNRRRFQVVTWAAMRFLLQAQRQNTRRMRLEQFVLLAMRVLLILLIVLAMAAVSEWAEKYVWAAVWPDGAGFVTARKGRTHKIIVIDGSMSMAVKTKDGKTAFERACEIASDIVKDSQAGDGFSIAVMKESPTWVVGEIARDAAKVAGQIEVSQSHGNASAAAVLNMVAAKLSEVAGRFDSREVYFITDMQQATWAPPEVQGPAKTARTAKEKAVLQEIQKRARTVFVDVGRDDVNNLAVTDLRLDPSLITTGMPVLATATVKNFGRQLRQQVRVELWVGRARAKADDPPWVMHKKKDLHVTVAAGGQATIHFEHKFSAPGTYAVQVRVEPDDLEPDDARTVIVTVKETVPVLLVNGKAAVEPFDRATEYLRYALNPWMALGGPIPKIAPLRPKVVTVSQFADASESNLAAYDCIYLCDVGQLGPGEVHRLETHLRRGGGLVVACGDQVANQIDLYNRLLYKDDKGLLPAKLIGVQAAPKDHRFYLAADNADAYREPPLKAFADPDDSQSLAKARFRQYLRTKPADTRARTILSFRPEVEAGAKVNQDKTLPVSEPALIEWNPPLPPDQPKLPGERTGTPEAKRYRGKVILYTSTMNMDWTGWPGSPSYGAMMQELVRLAISGRVHQQAYTVNSTLEEFLLTPGAELDTTLIIPGQESKPEKTRTQGTGDVTLFRWGETEQSGVYRLTVGQDPQQHLFAVNVPASTPDQRSSESDPTRLNKAELQAAYPDWNFQIVTELGQVQHGKGTGPEDSKVLHGRIGPTIAHYALLAVLGLLLLEVILACVFGHYTKAAGASVDPPRTGALWPSLIGASAAFLFICGAGVLIHAWMTGNFLGFLPEWFRQGIEDFLGMPPAPPGEGTRWSLESMSWLTGTRLDPWLIGGIVLGAALLVLVTYLLEGELASAAYKALLGGLRLFVILLTLYVLLPQMQLTFERQGWPDVVILIDDSLSMGESDYYQDERVAAAAEAHKEKIKKRLQETYPAKIKALETRLEEARKAVAAKTGDSRGQAEVEQLSARLQSLQQQLARVDSPNWRPARLQFIQSLLADGQPDWLQAMVGQRHVKVHVYHLDQAGRAVKLRGPHGKDSDLGDLSEPGQLNGAREAIADLEAHAHESRLGSAVRQVLDNYRGSSLAAVVMLTDGVTTRDETIGQVAEYAAHKAVPLFFVGVGDDHEVRELRLHDLQVEDTVYVNDRVVFEARLTGHGYKDLTVPVVLKVKDGQSEKELSREIVRVDPQGKAIKVRLVHQPTEPGEKLYIIEAELPKKEKDDKSVNTSETRLQRSVFVQEAKVIKVLFVEGSARYEYRYIKNLLERESPQKKNRTVELKVLLVDSDDDFPKQDRSAIAEFPINKTELYQYDVILFGDVDPRSPKLSDQKLRDLADFVRERGGGFLMIAGPNYSPHAYKDTPLAEILPIDIGQQPLEPEERTEGYHPELTPVGRLHPIFRFSPDDAENVDIWGRLAPIYWWSEGYRLKPLAEVLAVHPKAKAEGRAEAGGDGRHPLVVQQFVGAGRSMFFGFEESWRWRFREDELRFNQFWIQTVRYLSRNRLSRTELRLDRQTPYRQGEAIKVTVKFPDSGPLPGQAPGQKPGAKIEVKVVVEHTPPGTTAQADKEIQTLQLGKIEGSWGTYEGVLTRTREGKYRFWLSTPDVSKQQPNAQKPGADAVVVLPPGELDRLRMNQAELKLAAEATEGRFYTLATAVSLPDELPSGMPVVLNSADDPLLIWNHALTFLLVLALLTGEWLLRKRKHLL